MYLADRSAAQVHSYYQLGDLYAVDDATGRPVAIVLTISHPDDTVELNSVAVVTAQHGQGIGTRLLGTVLDDLRRNGTRRVMVGTSSSSIGPARVQSTRRCPGVEGRALLQPRLRLPERA